MEGDIRVYRPPSHMWPEPANTFLIADADGAIIIDAGCGWPDAWDKLKAFLAAQGFAPADVHTVVLSHAHPDHMGAMPFLLAEASPRIYIHSLEVELARDPRLLNRSFDMCHITDYFMERLGDTDPASLDILDYFSSMCPMGDASATDTFDDGDVLTLGGHDFEVVLTPGHAPGHVCLFERATATLLTFDLIGEVVAWYCPSGGGARGYLDSLDRVEALHPRLIMPSHGQDITDVAGAIETTRKVLLGRERRILGMLAEGDRTLLELTDELFPPPTRMFPGLQITDSHLIKLEQDGLVVRRMEEGMPRFSAC